MKKRILFLLLPLGIFFLSSSISSTPPIAWEKLDNGLEYALVQSPILSSHNDSKIDVLRFNPKIYKLQLLSAKEKKTQGKHLDQWCEQYKCLAGVNAGMFKLDGDFQTCTGYMKNFTHVNNPNLNPAYKTILAFNAKDTTVPAAQLIDLSCQNWAELKSHYNSFAQGLRMMNCSQTNTWQLQEKKWSMVTVAEDMDGNILFIFTRSPYRVHDYINILKSLPLQLIKMMYLEGGPEASFYLNGFGKKVTKYGSYETGFNERDTNDTYWDIPNVLGIKKN